MTMSPNNALTIIRPPPGFEQDDYIDAEWSYVEPKTLKCDDIATPVYSSSRQFHQGNVIKFRQYQEKSKTRSMIAYLFYLLEKKGYHGKEVYANCWLQVPGAHWLSNLEFKKLLKRAFDTEAAGGKWVHSIFLAMDADELWPYITQQDKDCATTLRRIGKCYKRNIYFLYEIHAGKGVPRYLRVMTEVSMKPFPDGKNDRVMLGVCDGARGGNYLWPVEHISRVNRKYNRFGDDEE
jgi:hypothetical protein